jgi:hypothetical protein
MTQFNRNEMRQVFFDTWCKYQEKQPLEPIEAQLIDIILLHPEYHFFLTDPARYQDADFVDANPFLHLSLHLALREQINTNRPSGISGLYHQLCVRLQNSHDAEHAMLDCLSRILWDAQQANVIPDEQMYLESLKRI